jgi:hypothetical protein
LIDYLNVYDLDRLIAVTLISNAIDVRARIIHVDSSLSRSTASTPVEGSVYLNAPVAEVEVKGNVRYQQRPRNDTTTGDKGKKEDQDGGLDQN